MVLFMQNVGKRDFEEFNKFKKNQINAFSETFKS